MREPAVLQTCLACRAEATISDAAIDARAAAAAEFQAAGGLAALTGIVAAGGAAPRAQSAVGKARSSALLCLPIGGARGKYRNQCSSGLFIRSDQQPLVQLSCRALHCLPNLTTFLHPIFVACMLQTESQLQTYCRRCGCASDIVLFISSLSRLQT